MDFDRMFPRIPEDVAKAKLREGEFYLQLATELKAGRYKSYSEVAEAIGKSPYGRVAGTQSQP